MSNNSKKGKVGYKNPPKDTQFKPGKSGNPKGRPVKKENWRDFAQIFYDELNKEITVTENGQKQTITSKEAFLKQLFHKAIIGDLKAMKMVIDYYPIYGQTIEKRIKREEQRKYEKSLNPGIDFKDPIAASKWYKQFIKEIGADY